MALLLVVITIRTLQPFILLPPRMKHWKKNPSSFKSHNKVVLVPGGKLKYRKDTKKRKRRDRFGGLRDSLLSFGGIVSKSLSWQNKVFK